MDVLDDLLAGTRARGGVFNLTILDPPWGLHPVAGVVEDPATGAAAAALGGYLRTVGHIAEPAKSPCIQGEDMGQRSELVLRRESTYAGATFLAAEPNDPYDVTAADLWATSTLSVKLPARSGRRLLLSTADTCSGVAASSPSRAKSSDHRCHARGAGGDVDHVRRHPHFNGGRRRHLKLVGDRLQDVCSQAPRALPGSRRGCLPVPCRRPRDRDEAWAIGSLSPRHPGVRLSDDLPRRRATAPRDLPRAQGRPKAWWTSYCLDCSTWRCGPQPNRASRQQDQ